MLRHLVVVSTIVSWLLCSFSEAQAAGQSPATSAGVPAPVASESGEDRKIVGITLLGAGVVAIAAGTALAINYDRPVGPCDARFVCPENSNRVPLGLLIAGIGGTMGWIGTLLWLQAPKTNTTIGMTTSGLLLSGRF
jgi:hypothetical protein